MKEGKGSAAVIGAAILLLILSAAQTSAQVYSGDIHGVVSSETGEPLPGVTVELSGSAPTARISDERGEVHFVGLAPGPYRLQARLDGFPTLVVEGVDVRIGHATAVELTMVSAVEEVVNVVSEAPLLDERKISAGASVARVELEEVPSARDPWVMIQTVPGVLTDTVNVGGNKSGRQQGFVGTGSFGWDNTWAVDGVVITDMAYSGSSTYYDFDAFEEMQISTGGTDVSRTGAGVIVNLVTRRGANAWRGSGRFVVADDSWQSGLELDESDLGDGQESFAQGDRIDRIDEWGVEGGGPLVEDRLWIWANYARNGIGQRTVYDYPQDSDLGFHGLKLNAQVTTSNSVIVVYQDSTKTVDGRLAGPSHPPETTWNQEGNTRIYKFEDSHVVTQRVLVNGFISYVDQGFELLPKGGLDGPNTTLDENFTWRHNFWAYESERPQRQLNLGAHFFATTRSVAHELEFGAGYREQETGEQYRWPGDVFRHDYYTSFGYPFNIAQVSRPEVYAYSTDYVNFVVQDTLRWDRLTANLGLRYDRQKSRQDAATVPGVEGFETLPDSTPLLPGVTFEGRDLDFTWEDLQPRLGVTYALGEGRSTLLRASYSRFAEQLFQFLSRWTYPLGPSEAYFFYQDADGDERVTVDEIIGFENGPLFTNGYDPLGQTAVYEIDPGNEAPVSDEVIVAVEHALHSDLVAGLRATWRAAHRNLEQVRLVSEDGTVRPHRRDDYALLDVVEAERPDGTIQEVPVWGLRGGVEDTGRTLFTSGDRESEYLGISLTLDKRLSDRWMARGHVTWMDWTWDIPESELADPNRGWEGWDDDGGPVHQHPVTPGWSYRLGGLLEIAPERWWGFNLAGSAWGREGYGIPYYVTAPSNLGGGITIRLQATDPVDEFRMPDVHVLDLRLDKKVKLGRDFAATIGIECFNVLNQSTVLERNPRLDTGATDHVFEVMSPRVFRLYTRLSFR